MTDPVNLSKDHTHQLAVIRGRCPELDAMRRHVEAFAQMIRELLGDALDEWMDAVPADDLPQLHSFVTGLRRDQHAVVADLRLPYSSGPVEGVVNRIKLS
jgi:transposase